MERQIRKTIKKSDGAREADKFSEKLKRAINDTVDEVLHDIKK
jgi:hypothetical protein